MNNKQVFLIPIAVMVLAIAPTTALATNESSYRYGYHTAISDYKFYNTDNNNNEADPPNSNITGICQIYQNGVLTSPAGVTNETACEDGYVNGWRAWCHSDTSDCTDMVRNDNFPHQ